VSVTAAMGNPEWKTAAQIPPNEQKDQQIQFSISLFSFQLKICFSPIET